MLLLFFLSFFLFFFTVLEKQHQKFAAISIFMGVCGLLSVLEEWEEGGGEGRIKYSVISTSKPASNFISSCRYTLSRFLHSILVLDV